MNRDYSSEYKNYHSKDKQKKNQINRNTWRKDKLAEMVVQQP